jgi:hypothetical protein
MKSLKLLIILPIPVLFFMCQNPNDHSKKIEYYVALQKDANKQSRVINEYIYKLATPFKDFYYNPDATVDKTRIDSINKSSELVKLSIINSINNLSELKEIDTEINLKEKCIRFYTETESYLDSMTYQITKVLIIGIKNATDEQKKAIMELASKREIFKKSQEELSSSFNEFLIKYNITPEELKNNGL